MFLEAKVQKLHETRVSYEVLCIFISHNILLLTFQFLGSYAHIMIQYNKIAKGGQRGQSLKYLEACFQCIDLTFLSENWDGQR